jgi:hypothetical protein
MEIVHLVSEQERAMKMRTQMFSTHPNSGHRVRRAVVPASASNVAAREKLKLAVKADMNSDIVAVPDEGFRDRNDPLFPVRTEELFRYR